LSAIPAKPRWRAFSRVSRSTPQWNVATTTSARRRARLTLERMLAGVACWVPARSALAKNEAGRMSEKPTKAISRPRRSTMRGSEAEARLPPAPTALIPRARVRETVSSKARVPKSPTWLLARLRTSKPA